MFFNDFHRHAGVFHILRSSPSPVQNLISQECIGPPWHSEKTWTPETIFTFAPIEDERTRGKSVRLKFFYSFGGLPSSLRNAKGGRIFFGTRCKKRRSDAVCSHCLICTHAILKRGIRFISIVSCGLSFWAGRKHLFAFLADPIILLWCLSFIYKASSSLSSDSSTVAFLFS